LADRIEYPEGPPEWDGAWLDGTLLIITPNEHIGELLRRARFIPMAAGRARHCIVLVERRLVPLYARSFPGVDVRTKDLEAVAAQSEARAMARFRTLRKQLSVGEEAIYAGFRPLQPDPSFVRALRRKYSPEGRPLTGFAWFSTNKTKKVPAIFEWADFMRSFDTTFVSLQYGEVAQDITALRTISGRNVIHDEAVDSLEDLDAYAAQVLATNLVVTISNTCAHMAGALGVPTFLIMDDNLRLSWPAQSDRSPWYPTITIIRKRGRSWAETFTEVRSRASRFIDQRRIEPDVPA
jgi:hypothetical protein